MCINKPWTQKNSLFMSIRCVCVCVCAPSGSVYTVGPAGSIQCYCDELPGVPSAECLIPHEFRCNSSRGCYIRRWYSELHGRIQQSWGCIQGQHGTEAQFDLWRVYCGALNTDNDVYKCCNSSNLCNKHLNITLQTEQQGTALSPSPSLILTEPRGGE